LEWEGIELHLLENKIMTIEFYDIKAKIPNGEGIDLDQAFEL
jgi:hypothetical protein